MGSSDPIKMALVDNQIELSIVHMMHYLLTYVACKEYKAVTTDLEQIDQLAIKVEVSIADYL